MLAFLSVTLLTSCGEGDIRLNMATGGAAGTYYPLGGAMATVINDRTGISVTAMASGASIDNVQQLSVGDAQIALAQNDIISYAFNGTGIWADAGRAAVTNISTLMTLYPETIQIVVLYDSPIWSVSDLFGARVSVGDIGSGTEANAAQILGAYGLSFDDITRINLPFGASADEMRDGNLDAFFVTAATPNTAITELSVHRDIRILHLSQASIDYLLNTYSFFTRYTVTSEAYSWISMPVNTVAVQATLVARTDVDEEVAYEIVRALIEGSDDIGHARGAYITPQNAVESVSIPFHPGAERFFREIGMLP